MLTTGSGGDPPADRGQLHTLADTPTLAGAATGTAGPLKFESVSLMPIDDSELELLEKLRKLRNNVVHGRSSEQPVTDDVDYATSIVARMLVFHASRFSQGGTC
jgi:hypothetical protein